MGLIRDDKNEFESYTPLIGRIPIIGWFYRGKALSLLKNVTLFVLLRLSSHVRNGPRLLKKHKTVFCLSSQDNQGSIFNKRDPIAHIFFKEHTDDQLTRFCVVLKYESYDH